ncbi:hypothetical protein M413DRAFT_170047 [Hebeloma cylindrosporum]|uniref:Zn(2)-C6 fungal-type domain-containing protein n=1 Tax=Hebeloma cylindrosporum TaxID=76867 RepID=A0A0C2XR61_HEBCY|nr:hypothetical protein M413DRAFT_170047 [Hebeloma cylindrosporum h7]
MPFEAAQKKRNADSTAAPDGDHRKRRRNRTTQSCLNCHTSKRMCDRKRPACARCTQLGLTGLCVYEVDYPNQRAECQEESSRLLKRVAELEGVIRELKNKPHPRWVQSSNSGAESGKWHSRTGIDVSCLTNHPSSHKEDSSLPCTSHSNFPKPFTGVASQGIHPQIGNDPRHLKSPCITGSSSNGTSPGPMTPTDEYPFPPIGIANSSSIQDYDLASMFLNYSGLMGCNEVPFPFSPENKQNGHCGCLHEPTSYNNMLEFSLRLRRASDVLARSPNHQLRGFCPFHQRISELDSFTTNVLSNVSTSPRSLPDDLKLQRRYPLGFPQRYSPVTRPEVLSLQSWDALPPNDNAPVPLDDSFMSWEPPKTA